MSDPSELPEALLECLNIPAPFFLDVAVAKQSDCLPMIAAGAGHDQVMRDATTYYDGSR